MLDKLLKEGFDPTDTAVTEAERTEALQNFAALLGTVIMFAGEPPPDAANDMALIRKCIAAKQTTVG